MQIEDFVDEIVTLGEFNDDSKPRLRHLVKLVILQIKSYCNLTTLPEALNVVVIDVCLSQYSTFLDRPVIGLREGEVAYKFADSQDSIRSNLKTYQEVLDAFTTL